MLKLKIAVLALLLSVVAPAAFAQGICPQPSPYNKLITGTTYTIGQADACQIVTFTSGSSVAISLPSPGTQGGYTIGFRVDVFMSGAGQGTITPLALRGSTATINGGSSLVVPSGKSVRITVGTDGNFYSSLGGSSTTATVAQGGTGRNTLTLNSPLVGNGTSPIIMPTPGTNGQIFYGNTSAAPSFGTPQSNISTPSNPSGTASLTGVMMGLAGGITPTTTGRVQIAVTGDTTSTTSSDGQAITCKWGTGAAPTNGAAATGTAVGVKVQSIAGAGITPSTTPFSCGGIITGITPSTAIWFDLQLAAVTGGTASVNDVTISSHEF